MKLEMKECTLGYGTTPVLRKASFILNTDEIVCVLGKNGAGKTTLFKALMGLLKPQSGSILLNGQLLDRIERRTLAQQIAYIPQAHSLPFPFRVLDFVLFGRTAHVGTFSYPGRKDKIIALECLDRLGILSLQDRIFTQLSGGEQQMVVIARALAQQPSFLIMDEPTSHLDFGNQIKIIRQVKELKCSSIGIIMATHSPDHAFMCDAKIALVHEKTIKQSDNINDILTEKNLQSIYNIDVKIEEITISADSSRKICIPVIE